MESRRDIFTDKTFTWVSLFVGGNNGVEIQIYATGIFDAVLNDLCSSVAVELGQPKERISVEMVFRGLDHFSRALLRGESTDVVTYLVEHHKRLGLIKQELKGHIEKATYYQEIWVSTAYFDTNGYSRCPYRYQLINAIVTSY